MPQRQAAFRASWAGCCNIRVNLRPDLIVCPGNQRLVLAPAFGYGIQTHFHFFGKAVVTEGESAAHGLYNFFALFCGHQAALFKLDVVVGAGDIFQNSGIG